MPNNTTCAMDVNVCAWAWQVELHNNPDAELEQRNGIVATTDGVVLDAVGAWFNLTWYIIEHFVPNGKTVALAE